MSIELTVPLTESVREVSSRMDCLRHEFGAGVGRPPARLARVAEAVRIQSIAASCRLSGIHLSDLQAAEMLAQTASPLADWKAVQGYAAALRYRFPDTGWVLDTDTLRRFHETVLGEAADPARSDTDGAAPWRLTPTHCEAFDSEGHAVGRVIPILPPRMIPKKLEDLLTWFELEMHSDERHPVPVIATFVLGLMAISPFERANGRTIRALTVHLLARAGYSYAPYASLEREMEELRGTYYEAFDAAQAGIWTGSADLTPWLEYFSMVLDRHRARAESRLRAERGAADLSELQRAILDAVREHGIVDAGLLLRTTGANRNTLKDNLRRMVDRGFLERTGQRRTARYKLVVAVPAVESERPALRDEA